MRPGPVIYMSGFAIASAAAADWIPTWVLILLAVASVALCVWLERSYDAKVRNDTELRVRYELYELMIQDRLKQATSNQREG